MSSSARAIFGCSGLRLTPEERALFRDARPWGFILFGRNLADADQVRGLIGEMRDSIEDADALVFVDQEGGRVQRLKPPLAKLRPPAKAFGDLYARDAEAGVEAVRLNHRLLAHELAALGFNADCAPDLDVLSERTTKAIGDRAFADDAATVATLGRAALEGLRDGGVAGVVKHMPGHGRGAVDSHFEMPVVDAAMDELSAVDFAPFRALADAPMGMTAHVLFTHVDGSACGTLSPAVIGEVIRGRIGFDGLLMTDDLSMKALKSPFPERTRAALEAGCDLVLHCNGEMAEMKAVASALTPLDGKPLKRAEAARRYAVVAEPFDVAVAEARLAEWGLSGA